jgi:hypothetical protein
MIVDVGQNPKCSWGRVSGGRLSTAFRQKTVCRHDGLEASSMPPVKAASRPERGADLPRENTRLESEGQAVGNLDGLVQLREGINSGDRSEDLFT